MLLTLGAPPLSSAIKALEAACRIDWLGRSLRAIDAVLRRRMGIEEFCGGSACILRLAMGTAERDTLLADGTLIRKGDPIGELHLWNEHLPHVAEAASGVAWALEIRRRFEYSFAQLARHIEQDRRFGSVAAVRGAISFARGVRRDAKLERVMTSLGIEIVAHRPGRFATLFEIGNAVFTLGLIRAFDLGNCGAVRMRRQRHELWLSRRTLRTRYGGAEHSGDASQDDAMLRKSAA